MEHWRRGNEELLRLLAEHEAHMWREYAASLELIAELVTRNVVVEVGYRTLPQLLRDVLRISTREATRRVSHAGAVTSAPAVSGGVVPAAFPVVAAAVRDGAVLSREDSAVLLAVVSALAKLRPSSETGPDPRSAAERQGDALAEVVRLAADTGLLPSEAGEKPHITVTVPLAVLQMGLLSAPGTVARLGVPAEPATLAGPNAANVASSPADDHAVLEHIGHLNPESAPPGLRRQDHPRGPRQSIRTPRPRPCQLYRSHLTPQGTGPTGSGLRVSWL